MLNVILTYLILDLGEAPEFMHCLKQAVLAPPPLRLCFLLATCLLIGCLLQTGGSISRWMGFVFFTAINQSAGHVKYAQDI